MDIDRDVVIQVTISVGVVVLFVLALGILSDAYGATVEVENETLEGSLEGEFDDLEVTDGEVEGTFEGVFENDIQAELAGDVNGTLTDESLDAHFDGTIDGAIEGTATGTMTGSFDEDDGTFDGEFDGTAAGTTSKNLSPDGGLVLLGLILAFIVLMPTFGYLIERLTEDEEE